MTTIYVPDRTYADALMKTKDEKAAKKDMQNVLERAYAGSFHKATPQEDTEGVQEQIRVPDDGRNLDPGHLGSVTLSQWCEPEGGSIDPSRIVLENYDVDDTYAPMVGRAEIHVDDIPAVIEALEELYERGVE